MKVERIFFNPAEVAAIGMGLARVMEDMNAMKKNGYENTPWTPEARKIQADMMAACRSAANKLEKFAGYKCELPPYEDGDENEFLTKQS
jgi:hypothetical protein